jgi:hypothetical protein
MLPGTTKEASAQVSVSMGVFDDTLSPYGTWVTIGRVGRVWRPSVEVVGDDFQPYATNGHWVYTDYGWFFESDWDWGWAPFHYGRWYDDPDYGWVWTPGTTWGPAWVDWRFGGGYVGWVPLAPSGVTVTYVSRPRYWTFVPAQRFTERRMWNYRVPRANVETAFRASVVVPSRRTYAGTSFHAGPPPTRVAAAVGHTVAPVRLTPPRRGEVTTVRVTPNGVVKHAPPVQRAQPQPQRPGAERPSNRPEPQRPQPQRPQPQRTQPQPHVQQQPPPAHAQPRPHLAAPPPPPHVGQPPPAHAQPRPHLAAPPPPAHVGQPPLAHPQPPTPQPQPQRPQPPAQRQPSPQPHMQPRPPARPQPPAAPHAAPAPHPAAPAPHPGPQARPPRER